MKLDPQQLIEDARQGAGAESAARRDALNFRDDQFDLSDASIAIAMGVAGLAALPWHPGALVRLLS